MPPSGLLAAHVPLESADFPCYSVSVPFTRLGRNGRFMAKQALGMLETLGLLPALSAADAMLKTADVTLLGYDRVDPGLVTVYIEGDVSAVDSAIASGKRVATTLGGYLTSKVIPRPVDDLAIVLPQAKNSGVSSQNSGEGSGKSEESAESGH